MKCQSCGSELPTHGREAVEDGEASEVVMHVFDPEDEPSFVCSQTDYYCDLECAAEAQNGTNYEWEVSVTADVEHTPRVDADSADGAEEVARERIEEEYGVTADTIQYETELSDGRHQVCVWTERRLYETVIEPTYADAHEAGKEVITREHAVQTSDIHSVDARRVREVESHDGGDRA
ncbi:hypothetical protein [Natrinema pallidum]|uniref:Uncharacterized protein n=1 Tax=Natrinema pallidum TaxID=69527 RepID=A0A4P9TIC5_9EURY|nr:hypothetical protein [Natrinema pallidum]QCW03590.1 hypothetical protein FGF80_10200 [Natrinema pallidum]